MHHGAIDGGLVMTTGEKPVGPGCKEKQELPRFSLREWKKMDFPSELFIYREGEEEWQGQHRLSSSSSYQR